MSGGRVRRRITRPCIRCGRSTTESLCDRCAGPAEAERQSRQPYRAAYRSVRYREARRIRLAKAGGRCEAIHAETGERCPEPAVETHHVRPLSSARSYYEALALCDEWNLRAVCFGHNPRGPT